MTTLTDLEGLYLDLIAHCEMNSGNGATPEAADDVNTYTWADQRARDLGITEKGVGGVMSSLTQKGLIWSTDEGDDSGVGFTEAGFEAWKAWPGHKY
jgi:hypothetical protein